MIEIIINKIFDINNYIFILKYEIKNYWICVIILSVLFYMKNYNSKNICIFIYIGIYLLIKI